MGTATEKNPEVLMMQSKVKSLYIISQDLSVPSSNQWHNGVRLYVSPGVNFGGKVQTLIPTLRQFIVSSYDLREGAQEVIDVVEALIRVDRACLEAQPSFKFLIKRLHHRCQEL
jgi:hypothetical protein